MTTDKNIQYLKVGRVNTLFSILNWIIGLVLFFIPFWFSPLRKFFMSFSEEQAGNMAFGLLIMWFLWLGAIIWIISVTTDKIKEHWVKTIHNKYQNKL